MDDSLLDLLRKVDTPTVCNAIELVQGRRGFDAFTRGTLLASDPAAPALVGYARTARLRALVPPQEPAEVIRTRRMDYYRYMAESATPSVVVIEDADFPHAVGAYWGEINTNVHKGFGLTGVLTNGVMRDLGDLPDDFPVLAGSIGPSHAFVHLIDFDQPVTVFGLEVRPGDLMHADRHGALVIPPDCLAGLAEGIDRLVAMERLVIDPAREPDFDFERFASAWAEFEKARV